MKIFYLADDCDKCIYDLLKREYIKLDYACTVNEIVFLLQIQDSSRVSPLLVGILEIMRRIILDNIFKYVVNKDANRFSMDIRTSLFPMDISISIHYIREVFEICDRTDIPVEDSQYFENRVHGILVKLITNFYYNELPYFNEAAVTIFDYLNTHFSKVNIGYYKFEVYRYVKPILMFSERIT